MDSYPDSRDELLRIEEYGRKPGDPVVAVMLLNPKEDDIFLRLAEKARDRALRPILILRPDRPAPEALPDGVPHFVLPRELFREMRNVAVCVATDSWDAYPESSRVILIPHGFATLWGDDLPEALAAYGVTLLTADYLFLPHAAAAGFSQAGLERAWTNRFPDVLARRKGPFTVIPGGYLKTDLLMERLAGKAPAHDAILVLPTPMNKFDEPFENNRAMIRAALDALPEGGMTVLYRPYPPDLAGATVQRLRHFFRDEPRLDVDENPSNLSAFVAARVLVTDFSLGRRTFSLATGRPNVIYRPEPGKEMERRPMGFTAHSQAQLTEAIVRCLADDAALRADVLAARDRTMLNAGKAYDHLLDAITACARGETRDEWISFNRRYLEGDWDDPETWQQLITNCQHTNLPRILRRFASERFPGNPLFSIPPHIWCCRAVRIDYESGKLEFLEQRELDDILAHPGSLPRFAVWGTSGHYRDNYRPLVLQAGERCAGFFDNNRELWGTELDGRPVMPPSGLTEARPELVILATFAVNQVCAAIHGEMLRARSVK